MLRHLLEDFGKAELNLSPSLLGSLDVIGNAYEYLIRLFSAGGGQKPKVQLAPLETEMDGYLKALGYE